MGRGGEEEEGERELGVGRGSEVEGGAGGVAEGEGVPEGEWVESRCDGQKKVGVPVVGVVTGTKEEGEGAEEVRRQEAEEERPELEHSMNYYQCVSCKVYIHDYNI